MRSLHRALTRFVLTCGLFVAPAALVPDAHVPTSRYAEDPRTYALREFLKEVDSPIVHLAEDFVIAADEYKLDWRLLPSIAFIESTAGKTHKNNNVFGWNNANTRFRSIREGIYFVGSRLGTSDIYQGRSMEEKLAIYNPYGHYAPAVIRVADQLARMEQAARTRTTTTFEKTELASTQVEAAGRSREIEIR